MGARNRALTGSATMSMIADTTIATASAGNPQPMRPSTASSMVTAARAGAARPAPIASNAEYGVECEPVPRAAGVRAQKRHHFTDIGQTRIVRMNVLALRIILIRHYGTTSLIVFLQELTVKTTTVRVPDRTRGQRRLLVPFGRFKRNTP